MIRRGRCAGCVQEALEIRNRATCLEIFRRFIIRTGDIFWIIRLLCCLCLVIWMRTVCFMKKCVKRIDISAKYRGISVTFKELIRKLTEDAESLSALLNERDRELFEDILANTISKKNQDKDPGKQALDRKN